ncbi:MAG: DedA family protein [Thermomicrobiales bacterium]
MNDRLLELLFTYGVVVLGPILFLSAIGVPLPGTILIVAAGAFASGGQLSFPLLLATAIVATLLGNGVGYWIGRRGGEAATTRWARRFHVSHDNIERAQSLFTRYGGLSVLFTRFPLSPLSAIVNIVAGAARYSIRTFVVINLIGVTVWASVYAGLGYAFGASAGVDLQPAQQHHPGSHPGRHRRVPGLPARPHPARPPTPPRRQACHIPKPHRRKKKSS